MRKCSSGDEKKVPNSPSNEGYWKHPYHKRRISGDYDASRLSSASQGNHHPNKTKNHHEDDSEYAGQRIIPALGRPSYFLEDEKCGFLSDPSTEDGGDTSSQASPFPHMRRNNNILPISPTSAEVSSLGNTSFSSKDDSEMGTSSFKSPKTFQHKAPEEDDTTANNNNNNNHNSSFRPLIPTLSRTNTVTEDAEGKAKLLQPQNSSEAFDLRPLPSSPAVNATNHNNNAPPKSTEPFQSPDQFATPESNDDTFNDNNNNVAPSSLIIQSKETWYSPEETAKKLSYSKKPHKDNNNWNNSSDTQEDNINTNTNTNTNTSDKHVMQHASSDIESTKEEKLERRKSKGESEAHNNKAKKQQQHQNNEFLLSLSNYDEQQTHHEYADDEDSRPAIRNRAHRRRVSSAEFGVTASKHRRIRSGDDAAASLMGNVDWLGMEVMKLRHPSHKSKHDDSIEKGSRNPDRNSHTLAITKSAAGSDGSSKSADFLNHTGKKRPSNRESSKQNDHSTLSDVSQEEHRINPSWKRGTVHITHHHHHHHHNYATDSSISSAEILTDTAFSTITNDKHLPKTTMEPEIQIDFLSNQSKPKKRTSSSAELKSTNSKDSQESTFSWISNGVSFFSGKCDLQPAAVEDNSNYKRQNMHKRSEPSSFNSSFNEYLHQSFASLTNTKEKNNNDPDIVAPNLLQQFLSPHVAWRKSPISDESSYIFGQHENLLNKELEYKRIRAFDDHLKSLSYAKRMPRQNIEVSEEDAQHFPTFICPRCKTRQREFFTVASAGSNFENPLGFLFLYFTIYVFASLFIFGLEEGWPALDCVYFSVITFTSTGFGDYVPTTDGAKIICSVFIYFGVACIGLLLGSLLANSQDEALRRQAKENLVKNCPNCARGENILKFHPRSSVQSRSQKKRRDNFLSKQTKETPLRSNVTTTTTTTKDESNTVDNTTGKKFESQTNQTPVKLNKQQESTKSKSQTSINSISEHHPLLDVKMGHPANDYNSYTPNTDDAQYYSQSPGSFGLPDPASVLQRQMHTRHRSLSHDFGSRFINTKKKQKKSFTAAKEFQSPSIREHEPYVDDFNSVPGIDNEFYEDYDDSDSFSSDLDDERDAKQVDDLKIAKYVFQTLHQALANSIFIIAIGSFGFSVIEGLSAVDSFYFTTVLLTTVGYGDITPQTNEGKAFACVYVLIAGTVLLHNMSLISMIPLEMRKRRLENVVLSQFGKSVDDATLMELATGPLVQRLQLASYRPFGLHECTREMFALAMLVRLGKVTERDVRATYAAFNRLDLDKDGKLSSKEIILSHVERQRMATRQRAEDEALINQADVPQYDDIQHYEDIQNYADVPNFDEFSDCQPWSDQNAFYGNEATSGFIPSLPYNDTLSPSRRAIFFSEHKSELHPSPFPNPQYHPSNNDKIDSMGQSNINPGYPNNRRLSHEHFPIFTSNSDKIDNIGENNMNPGYPNNRRSSHEHYPIFTSSNDKIVNMSENNVNPGYPNNRRSSHEQYPIYMGSPDIESYGREYSTWDQPQQM